MANIGFIGLGTMGLPMAINLVKKGNVVYGLDLSEKAVKEFESNGGVAAVDIADLMSNAEVVFTMLPTGPHVISMYEAESGIIEHATSRHLLIDCSTSGVPSARKLHALGRAKGVRTLDAPVTGAVAGAEAATLTIMVGGDRDVFDCAKPILEQIGKVIIHAGAEGVGQAAKICNNMVAGINKIALSEAFVLAKKLGLDDKIFFDVASNGSAQSFSLTKTCPVPGLVPTAPSSRNYTNGFTTKLLLKDMLLAQEAAMEVGAGTVLGSAAAQLYQLCANAGHADRDSAIIYQYLLGK
ncbi:3-hydroxyisobutyrate dehydrogenase [Noviherbaspirillum sp. Root189]|uniref:3-hydroxyisobutyrate dehydrogenase n=1 Tax=Noviherbaspirillum sp. Root189 TaxID=1736487 RepID=UPI00070D6831|nr:3-hydroxyisobutyrate dehydrogenase [Noviherbaspirillum sp. Root189]KRB81548.1 transposase [Noviherbaspirillum sp. Root189]